jgi:hypothetical protein
VVIDDASPDGTGTVADALAASIIRPRTKLPITRFRPKELKPGRAVVLGVLLSFFLVNAALDALESWPLFRRVTSPGGSSIHYGYHQLR